MKYLVEQSKVAEAIAAGHEHCTHVCKTLPAAHRRQINIGKRRDPDGHGEQSVRVSSDGTQRCAVNEWSEVRWRETGNVDRSIGACQDGE